MSKHTPEPWRVEEDLGFTVIDNSGTIICQMPYTMTAMQHYANSRLIAAAPDMYEAAKVQQECGLPSKVSMYDEDGCEGWLWSHPDGREWVELGDWSEPPTLHPLMKAAIAKAEGGGE